MKGNTAPEAGPNILTEDPAMLRILPKDLRLALRSAWKSPIISLIAIVSVALGIAASTTVFSLAHSFLLRPLPYPEADRLVLVWERVEARVHERDLVAPANYFDWQERISSFAELAAYNFTAVHLTGGERPEQVLAAQVTPSFLSTLGVEPLRGRIFLPEEGAVGNTPVVVSEALWQRRFGGDEGLLGRPLTLDGEVVTVVGVLPDTFDFFQGGVDLWQARDYAELRDERSVRSLFVVGLLAPEASVANARAELEAVASHLAELHPEANEGRSVRLETLREMFPGPTDRRLIQILAIVLTLVVLVACANVASLLLARSQARQQEMAVRTALGAGRGRLLRQLLTESAVLALAAGALGLFLARFGVAGTASSLPSILPAFYSPTMNSTVVLFGLGLSLLCGFAFGIGPAFEAMGGDLRQALLEGGRGGMAGRRQKRMLRAFVVVELAMALTILVGAALLTDVFHQRLGIEPGFDPENLLTFELSLPEHLYPEDDDLRRFLERAEGRLAAVPGAIGTTFTSTLPRSRDLPRREFTLEGQALEHFEQTESVRLVVSPSYFETLGITRRSGRVFTVGDRADTAPVVVVNERFLELFAEQGAALGGHLEIAGASREIVGVVDNITQRRLSGVEPADAVIYLPLHQHPVRSVHAILRSAADPYTLVAPAQATLAELASDQPMGSITTIEEHIAHELAGPTIIAQILYGVGLLVLTLAAMGIYGIMTFAVTQQTSEIGLRMALGARPRQILGRVTGQGARLAGLGLLLGLPLSFGVMKLVDSIFEASARDGIEVATGLSALPLAQVGGVLFAVGFFACYLPARRATRVDPVRALEPR